MSDRHVTSGYKSTKSPFQVNHSISNRNSQASNRVDDQSFFKNTQKSSLLHRNYHGHNGFYSSESACRNTAYNERSSKNYLSVQDAALGGRHKISNNEKLVRSGFTNYRSSKSPRFIRESHPVFTERVRDRSIYDRHRTPNMPRRPLSSTNDENLSSSQKNCDQSVSNNSKNSRSRNLIKDMCLRKEKHFADKRLTHSKIYSDKNLDNKSAYRKSSFKSAVVTSQSYNRGKKPPSHLISPRKKKSGNDSKPNKKYPRLEDMVGKVMIDHFSTSNCNKPNKCQESWKCFMCSMKNCETDFEDHLLFGTVNCIHCSWEAESCDEFRGRHLSSGCQHTSMCWSYDRFITYIQNQKRESVISFITKYLESTKFCQGINPWKDGYKYFQHKCESLKRQQIKGGQNFHVTRENIEASTATSKCRMHLAAMCTRNYSNSNEKKYSMTEVNSRKDLPQARNSQLLSNEKVNEISKSEIYNWKSKEELTESKVHPSKIETKDRNSHITKEKTSHSKNRLIAESSSQSNNRDVLPQKQRSSLSLEGHIPDYAIDNYLIVHQCTDDCPNCSQELHQRDIQSFLIDVSLVIVHCSSCSLYICFHINRNTVLTL